MQLGGRESSNVEDRRGMSPMMVGGGLGTIVLALVVYFLGGDPSVILQQPAVQRQPSGTRPAEENAQKHFVSVVLADTEDTWHKVFKERFRKDYVEPKLVLFTDVSKSGCGTAESAMGPFYCPLDQTVYVDLGFYRELRERFGATGDFAQAYVIAHEVGHHVQNQLGLLHQSDGRSRDSNVLSVRTELQADCLAGMWAHEAQQTRKILEPGDLEEALGAAAAIGDDRLQRKSQGRVVPESFTHGSSAQRVQWFRAGFDGGTIDSCDTSKVSLR